MKKDKYIEYYPNGMKWREVSLKDGKEMDYGLNGMRMDRKCKKKLTRVE